MENFSNSCTSFQINPHAQLGRLCVYGIYKRTMNGPTEENALALEAVDMEASTYGSRAKLQCELFQQLVQRTALPTTGEPPREAEVGLGSQQGKNADS